MKTSKRVLALLLSFFIISSISIFGQQGFREHWSYVFVKQLIDRQLLSETDASSEELDELITKDELYKQLRASNLVSDSISGSVAEKIYSFDSSDTYLTREEACIVLGHLINKDFTTELYFLDESELSEEGRLAMMKLNYFYIIDGYPDGYFSPEDLITRAEALKLISLLNKIPAEYLVGSVKDIALYRNRPSVFELLNPGNLFEMNFDSESSEKNRLQSANLEMEPQNENNYTPVTDAADTQTPLIITEPAAASALPNDGSILRHEFEKAPQITVTAGMGSKFRSLDVLISADGDKKFSVLYYLALEAGNETPSSVDILDYAAGRNITGLTDGTAVRGKLAAFSDKYKKELTLYGKEDIKSVKGETGFIDGYRYDFYLVGVDSDGNCSNIAASRNVMAMPFDAANFENNTYTIRTVSLKQIKEMYPDLQANNKNNSEKINRTARQLENIQRLADLYFETDGRHGDINFLTQASNTYILDDDIDLSEYKAFDGERGWKPIGNTDANEGFYFGGSFDGRFNNISNLYIDRDSKLNNDKTAYQGLFGKTQGATIRNLVLDNSKIIIEGVGIRDESYVGALAGYAVNSVIDNITLDSLNMKVYSPSAKTVSSVGGLIGFSENTDIASVTVNNASIHAKRELPGDIAYSDYTGGVTGSFLDLGEANLISDINVSGEINAAGFAAGGVAGRIVCASDSENHIYAYNINSLIRVNGEALNSGGVAGQVQNKTSGNTITFDNCYASGAISGSGNAGGIFGTVDSLNRTGFILKNSASEADVYSNNLNAVIGGVVASTSGGSYEYNNSVGSTVKSGLHRAGGFVGYVTGDTDFIGCMSNKSVDANMSAGGFAGEANGNVNFYECSSLGAIINAQGSDIGGFMGLQSGGNILLSGCFSTSQVTGGDNSGGLVGRVGADVTGRFIGCFSAGDIAGNVNIGGFIGRMDNESEITNSYSTGKVDVGGKEGSFIGNRQSSIMEAS